jgi:hypothetical protein
VAARQGAGADQIGDLHHPVGRRVIEHAGQGVHAAAERPARADRPDRAAVGARHLGAEPLAVGIVDAHHRGIAGALVQQHALLRGDVVVHVAVAVEVVGRDVQHHSGVRLEAAREVQLVGRALQDVHRAAVHVGQVQHADADVAADVRVAAGGGQHVAQQGGGGRLAVGAGDRGDLGLLVRGRGVHGPGEQLDVAQHLDAAGAGAAHGPVRFGVGQRNAGRERDRLQGRPVGSREILDVEALGLGGGAALGTVVPGDHLRPAGLERARGRQARPGQAEDGHLFALETSDRDHVVTAA